MTGLQAFWCAYLPRAPEAVLQGKSVRIFIRALVQLDQSMIGEDELLSSCRYQHQSIEQEENHISEE